MTDLYNQIVAGIEGFDIPAETVIIPIRLSNASYIQQLGRAKRIRSVNDILNNPSRLAFEFKRTQARFYLTCNLIDDILRGKV